MTPDEFERLKAKEREHLEKMRELKNAVRRLERQRSVVDALDEMRTGAHDLLDEQARLVEELARDTAFMEAKSEMAAEALPDAPDALEIDEEALRTIRAQQLVESIKAETDATDRSEPGPKVDTPDHGSKLPDKTIGRMR
jgi:hypothetical protein